MIYSLDRDLFEVSKKQKQKNSGERALIVTHRSTTSTQRIGGQGSAVLFLAVNKKRSKCGALAVGSPPPPPHEGTITEGCRSLRIAQRKSGSVLSRYSQFDDLRQAREDARGQRHQPVVGQIPGTTPRTLASEVLKKW